MFFNGFEVSHGAYEKHRMLHDSIDYDKLWNAEDARTRQGHMIGFAGGFGHAIRIAKWLRWSMGRRSAIGSFLTTTEFR